MAGLFLIKLMQQKDTHQYIHTCLYQTQTFFHTKKKQLLHMSDDFIIFAVILTYTLWIQMQLLSICPVPMPPMQKQAYNN